MAGEKYFMDHAENSPDHVARIVFWAIALSSLAFITGILILIR
jgi:hypothetical protein